MTAQGWTCSSCGQPGVAGARFCGNCGTPAAPVTPVATWSCRQCGTSNPQANAFCGGCGARAQAARSEELRLVTALFADISGFTTLADSLDVESLHEVITPLVRGLTLVAERYEGFVEKFAGDALLVVYGAPVTHEDDAQRALLAALDMHAELPRLLAGIGPHAAHLTIHIGVNTGRVIARQAGSEQQSDYAVLGDSVILAQRLESVCPPGQTYVGPTTYELCKDEFDLEPVGQLTLKGKLRPVAGYRLLGRRKEHVAAAAVVGREREVAQVLDALSGPVTALVGEPGAGKTRVLDQVRRQVTRPWLAARCLSYGASLAYWPLADLLRTELGGSAPEDVLPAGALPGARRLLGLETGGEPANARREVHDAVALWLRARPGAVLAVEDVHWADASTRDLLAELVRAEAPVSLLVTSRTGSPIDAATVVEVGALEPDAVGRVAAAVLEGPAAHGLVALLVDRTAGNPLHVTELCRALAESGTLVRTVEGWDVRPGADLSAVPTGIERVYATRLDALPPPAAALLQLVSVVGRTAPLSLLRNVDDSGGIDPTLEVLIEAQMLEHDGDAVTFSHALLQDVVYGRMLRKRRRELHRRVAEVARRMYGEADDVVGLLARHLYLADAGEEAVEPLLCAGRRAAGLYANDEAAVHLERALEVLGDDPRADEVRLELADLHLRRGAYEDALSLYRAGAVSTVRARSGEIAALRALGRYSQAMQVFVGAAQQFRTSRPSATLYLEAGVVQLAAGQPGDAAMTLRTGLRLADDTQTRALLLTQVAHAEEKLGRLVAAEEHAAAAVGLLDADRPSAPLVKALRVQGAVLANLDRTSDAVAVLDRARTAAAQVGLLEEAAGCLVNIGLAAFRSGAHDAAAAAWREALALFQRIGVAGGRLVAAGNLADALVHLGQLEEAEAWARQAQSLAEELDQRFVLADVLRTRGRIAQARGDASSASALLRRAAGEFRALDVPGEAAECDRLLADVGAS